eukprot:3864862-Rhodomonas_salina.3
MSGADIGCTARNQMRRTAFPVQTVLDNWALALWRVEREAGRARVYYAPILLASTNRLVLTCTEQCQAWLYWYAVSGTELGYAGTRSGYGQFTAHDSLWASAQFGAMCGTAMAYLAAIADICRDSVM